MADEEKATCKNCIHYSRGISENGYCSFYHHNLSDPERICSRFEIKHDDKQNCGTMPDESTVIEKSSYKGKTSGVLAYFTGIVCAVVIFAACLIIGVSFAGNVFSSELSIPVKLGIAVVTLSLYGIFIWGVLALLRDHTWVFVIYLVIALGIILLLLLDFVNVWLSVNNFNDLIVEYIVNGF